MKIKKKTNIPLGKSSSFQNHLMGFLIPAVLVFFSGFYPMEARAGDFEITPLFGYTWGGGFENSDNGNDLDLQGGESLGLILGWEDTSRIGAIYELFYMRQANSIEGDGSAFSGLPEMDIDIDYLHIGGTYGADEGRVLPFVSGGLGITHMSPEVGDSEVRFSLSLGAGLKVPITDHINFRLEGRGFGTVFNGSSEIFCSGNQCVVSVSGDMFWQFSALAGVGIVF